MKRFAWASVLAGALVVPFALGQSAKAAGGDFSLDFTAAAPHTYDHSTGGGSYNDRTVGVDNDIVESLEGGDFACGDIVTFLTQIRVDAGATGKQTIRITLAFTSYSTGQQGVALVSNAYVGSGIDADINPSAIDSGTVEVGGGDASATVIGDGLVDGPGTFVKPTVYFRTVDVDGLDPGETVVLRTDVAIACNGSKPTGNMQAWVVGANTVNGVGGDVLDTISVGQQTVPFKHVGDIKACDPKDPKCVL
jgi:hypothetical protein